MNRLFKPLAAFLLGLLSLSAYGQPEPNIQMMIRTSEGDIKIELDKGRAPITVDNFLKYVEKDAYKDVIFHRVIEGFMIQTGGHTADLTALDEMDTIYNEAKNGLRNVTGSIAMARGNDIDSASRQFFINVADNYFLDHQKASCSREDEIKQKVAQSKGLNKPVTCKSYGYAVFGRVLDGMDVVRRIEAVTVGTQKGYENVPETPITIKVIERI